MSISEQLAAPQAGPSTQALEDGQQATTVVGGPPVVPSHIIVNNPAVGSVPKPRGSAGGGQHGYHLQAAMSLGDVDGDRMYNMILVSTSLRHHHVRLLTIVNSPRCASLCTPCVSTYCASIAMCAQKISRGSSHR